MRHPDVVARLRADLDASQDEELSFDAVHSPRLVYAMAVFYESLRLYPPVPFEIKQCEAATTLPDGTFLPKGAIVLWCPWAMGRSTRIWPDEPGAFRPERWLETADDGTPRLRTRTQYEFPVFNGGPRTCLGKKMAELQAVFVIASLVRDFDFEEAGVVRGADGKLVERRSRNSLTLPMEGGLPCRVRTR